MFLIFPNLWHGCFPLWTEEITLPCECIYLCQYGNALRIISLGTEHMSWYAPLSWCIPGHQCCLTGPGPEAEPEGWRSGTYRPSPWLTTSEHLLIITGVSDLLWETREEKLVSSTNRVYLRKSSDIVFFYKGIYVCLKGLLLHNMHFCSHGPEFNAAIWKVLC